MAYFKKILEYTFGGTKVLKVVFSQCDCFDPVNSTRMDDFGMVDVKHESRYSFNNLLFAHQVQLVYYLKLSSQKYEKLVGGI
jgi:hypothetical protein